MMLFAVARGPTMAVLASVVAGAARTLALATLNVSAQLALPDWVRGRGLSHPLCRARNYRRHGSRCCVLPNAAPGTIGHVEACIAAGLVGGEGFAVDASLIESLVAFWGKGDIGSNL